MSAPAVSASDAATAALPAGGEIYQFLGAVVADLEPHWAPHDNGGRGRPRILPALALWSTVLVSVLEGDDSQRAVWRRLSDTGVFDQRRYRISDEAVYRRLAAGGTQPIEQLFQQVSTVLARRLRPYADRTLAPFATDVLALDATTLDPLARLLPPLRGLPPSDPHLAAGQLLGPFWYPHPAVAAD